jgi:hypothetical protein
LVAPFLTPDEIGAKSSDFSGMAQSRPVSSRIDLNDSPSFILNESRCYPSGDRDSTYWDESLQCLYNTIWLTNLNSATTTWWQPAGKSGLNSNQLTLSTSYNYWAVDQASAKWGSGSSQFARLDYKNGSSLKLGPLTQDALFTAGGTSKWRSITGGISSTGLEDGSWILGVNHPSAGDPTLYLIKNNSGAGVAQSITLPVGYAPSWTWVAQCGNCASPTNQRSLVMLDTNGRLRWGSLNISTGSFSEAVRSATVCSSGTGCAKFGFSGLTAPKITDPIWHNGHLFPARYTANTLGNNSFVLVEKNSANVWSLDLGSGAVARLGVAGARLTSLHCNNYQTAPSLTPGVPLDERCYVGDRGNEGVHELR